LKKRDEKANDKSENAKKVSNGLNAEEKDEPVLRDEMGRVIFHQQDFENALILHFKTNDVDEKADADYKVSWKDLENLVKEKFDKLKVVYSRADKYDGHLAISSFKLNK